ncbi:MAG: hypothetical protein ING90_04675, partial [Rhodocyclaceae bacterium]|nr:hypothetical protein [Rhodocyclaceae bacterium]
MTLPDTVSFDAARPAFNDRFESLLATDPASAALVLGDSQSTRAELVAAARAFAALLHARGIGRGDVINVWLPDG